MSRALRKPIRWKRYGARRKWSTGSAPEKLYAGSRSRHSCTRSSSSKPAMTMRSPRPSCSTWCAQLSSISVTPALPNVSHAVSPRGTRRSSVAMLAPGGTAVSGCPAANAAAHSAYPSSCRIFRTV
eukprot:7341852-Prymnesium_polylepis.1